MMNSGMTEPGGHQSDERAREFLAKEVPDAPAGLHEFWEDTFAEAWQIPLRMERREIPCRRRNRRLFEFECESFGGVRIGGWIVEPSDGVWRRGVVVGHGYGWRDEPGFDLPGPPAVMVFPCIRGFNRSATPGIPDVSSEHVMHGIASRDGYVIRGCVADIWAAASVMLKCYPEVEGALHFHGGSFCGGLGAMALAWDPRFERAFLDVPTFGNHPERVKVPCIGSGEPVRLRYLEGPRVLEVLAWYDAAVLAGRVRIPVLVAAALEDVAVPPVGQFSVYKGLGGEKCLFVRRSGHPSVGSDDRALWRNLKDWFGRSENSKPLDI